MATAIQKIIKEAIKNLRKKSLFGGKFKNSEEYKMLQNDSMVCPHLRQWNMTCCLSGNTGVVVAFMVQEFCRSINHKNCPFFTNSQRSIKLIKMNS